MRVGPQMRNSVFETILGAVVLLVAALFVFTALSSTDNASSSGQYEVIAKFDSVIGIDRGSDVRMAGVKIGSVVDVEYDTLNDEAILTMTVREDVELRDDSNARVAMDGLLGGSFVSLNPGGGFDVIATDGTGEIYDTQGSVDLFTLASSMFGGGSN